MAAVAHQGRIQLLHTYHVDAAQVYSHINCCVHFDFCLCYFSHNTRSSEYTFDILAIGCMHLMYNVIYYGQRRLDVLCKMHSICNA